MIDPTVGIKTELLQWFHNGVWQMMPHRHFFCNNLRQHFRRSGKHMPQHQRETWAEVYKESLLHKQIVKINNITFKMREEHETQTQ